MRFKVCKMSEDTLVHCASTAEKMSNVLCFFFLRKDEAFKCFSCTSGGFEHMCDCYGSPGALCVVALWLF